MFPSRDVYVSTIKFNGLLVQFLSSSHFLPFDARFYVIVIKLDLRLS